MRLNPMWCSPVSCLVAFTYLLVNPTVRSFPISDLLSPTSSPVQASPTSYLLPPTSSPVQSSPTSYLLPPTSSPTSPTLALVVDGVRNSRGVVGVLIFSSPRGWPEDFTSAFRAESVPAHPGTVMLVFDDLPPGAYAAVVLHDENANRKLDRNLFGVPREGWGMSNNPKAHLAAPSFESARFVLQESTELRIHLNY